MQAKEFLLFSRRTLVHTLPMVFAPLALASFWQLSCPGFSGAAEFSLGEEAATLVSEDPADDDQASQKPNADATYSRQEVEKYLLQLRSRVYRERQEAFLALWRSGQNAEPQLQEIAKSDDLDASTIAKWLLLLRKLGASPALANDGITNLSLLRAGDFLTLIRLAENQQWGNLLVLLELLTDEQRATLSEETADRENLLAIAIRQGKHELLPALVDRLYSPVEAQAARRLWEQLGLELAEISPKTEATIASQVFALEWSGQIDKAIEVAESNKLSELASYVRQRAFRWQELAPGSNTNPPNAKVLRDLPLLQEVALQSLYLEWSGQLDRSIAWRKPIREAQAKQFAPQEMASVLLMSGEVERALQVATKSDALDVHLLRSDSDAILRMIGIEDFSKLDKEDWLSEKKEQLSDAKNEPRELIQILAEASCVLYRLGEVDFADKIDVVVLEFAESRNEEDWIVGEVLSNWVKRSRRAKAIEYVARYLEKPASTIMAEPQKQKRLFFLSAVFPDFEYVSSRLLAELSRRMPNANWMERLEALDTLHNGSLPEVIPDRLAFEDFAWETLQHPDDDEISGAQVAEVLSELSEVLGYHQLSFRFLLTLPRYPANLESIARKEAANGNLADAINILDSMKQSVASTDLELQIQRAEWLDRLGRATEAKETRWQAMAIPFSSDSYFALFQRQTAPEFADESRLLTEFAWKTVEPSTNTLGNLSLKLSRLVEEEDPQRAAELLRVMQAQYLQLGRSIRIRLDSFLYFRGQEYFHLLRAAIERGDLESANRYLRKSFELLPSDIDVPIKVVPLAEKKFGKEIADQWFQIYFEYHLQHLAQWKEDAMYHNNLAWLSAKLDRYLDKAHHHASMACELKPNDPTYMDTLAEVEFRLGNIRRAIELSEQCRKLEGKDPHNREQIARFIEALNAKEVRP